MAHADFRHSTDALTRQYGLGVLFDIVFGKDKGQLVRIAAQIKLLQYSRDNESQCDMASVNWLYPTAYNAKGAAGFSEINRSGAEQRCSSMVEHAPKPR